MSLEKSLQRVVDDLAAAWNRRDWASFSRLFAENADYVTGSGVRWAGRRQILDALVARAPGPPGSGRVSLVTESVKALGADGAVVLCAWRMDPGDAPQTHGPGARGGFVTIVAQRAGDTWRIIALQNTDRTP